MRVQDLELRDGDAPLGEKRLAVEPEREAIRSNGEAGHLVDDVLERKVEEMPFDRARLEAGYEGKRRAKERLLARRRDDEPREACAREREHAAGGKKNFGRASHSSAPRPM